MRITPPPNKLKDPKYFTEYIGTAITYTFMFIMTFNLILVAMNYEQYRYELPPTGSHQPQENPFLNENTTLYGTPQSKKPEEWKKYEKITQTRYEELDQKYNRITWVSIISLTGLTLTSPKFQKRIKKLYTTIKESEE